MLNISHYKIVAIGKVKKAWIQSGIKIYLNRMPGLKVIELKDSNQFKEGIAIKEIIKKDEILITLNENGKCFTSNQFARKLQDYDHQNISFAIGGATGISPELNNSASLHLSLSPLTFPHEIARLLLIEQIYRAYTIAQGSPYHKG
mgnify:CR=1 FL=1